jgi:hypothetical protein
MFGEYQTPITAGRLPQSQVDAGLQSMTPGAATPGAFGNASLRGQYDGLRAQQAGANQTNFSRQGSALQQQMEQNHWKSKLSDMLSGYQTLGNQYSTGLQDTADQQTQQTRLHAILTQLLGQAAV